ncbi:MAG: hypothetical protein US25_C0042G0006 [Candidatus Moranbacteria bacterium GW2011_GWE1_36_7]|nr:MAG: hypothetical protein UR99_C0055G0006 [Candidatus Moranbacteria bacterium GW2011_GWD2_36_12]KKQ13137.1 MAG: hypothetical protein US25_C0042G0006 [Candidatus Moranbacteria bacterium GW2011_GWE1_36_7]
MICKNCKKEISTDSKFCQFCGTKSNKGYAEIIKKILEEKPLTELEQLNKKTWYRVLKVLYLAGITYGVGMSLTVAMDESSIGLFFAQLLLVFLVSESVKRSFYYICLGKVFPQKSA